MELEELKKLYNTSMDFRLYVDAWMKKAGVSLQEVFYLKTVQEYAAFVKERESNA